MSDADLKERVLAFATHIGQRDAERVAQRRNWIDAGGRPTEEGAALVRALADQDATRTVFRGNF